MENNSYSDKGILGCLFFDRLRRKCAVNIYCSKWISLISRLASSVYVSQTKKTLSNMGYEEMINSINYVRIRWIVKSQCQYKKAWNNRLSHHYHHCSYIHLRSGGIGFYNDCIFINSFCTHGYFACLRKLQCCSRFLHWSFLALLYLQWKSQVSGGTKMTGTPLTPPGSTKGMTITHAKYSKDWGLGSHNKGF